MPTGHQICREPFDPLKLELGFLALVDEEDHHRDRLTPGGPLLLEIPGHGEGLERKPEGRIERHRLQNGAMESRDILIRLEERPGRGDW